MKCPLKFPNMYNSYECERGECAWWDAANVSCSIVSIVEAFWRKE